MTEILEKMLDAEEYIRERLTKAFSDKVKVIDVKRTYAEQEQYPEGIICVSVHHEIAGQIEIHSVDIDASIVGWPTFNREKCVDGMIMVLEARLKDAA